MCKIRAYFTEAATVNVVGYGQQQQKPYPTR